jgi:triosephosphate isomerase
MSRPVLFAANWKMHLAPEDTRTFLNRFCAIDTPRAGRTVAFFPPAVSIEAAASALAHREHVLVGAQDVHWEPKGAFTGATSVPLARAAGARAALIGHSERRHDFGETDDETNLKVRAVLGGGLLAMLCVGETLAQRDAGETGAAVARQLRVGLAQAAASANLVIAYEPVWAIGTGRTATPSEAAAVHGTIRTVLGELGFPRQTRILYGGSANAGNVAQLLAEREIDGVLVGGASLDPEVWAGICAIQAD